MSTTPDTASSKTPATIPATIPPPTSTQHELNHSYGPEHVLAEDKYLHVAQPGLVAVTEYQRPHEDDYSPWPETEKASQKTRSPKRTLAILGVAVAVLIAVFAGALGGTLGTELASCKRKLSTNVFTSPSCTSNSCSAPTNNRNQTNTCTNGTNQTNTPINFVSPPMTSLTSLKNTCYDLRTQPPSLSNGTKLSIICGYDVFNGLPSKVPGRPVYDIVGVSALSLLDCAEICSQYNRQSTLWNGPCVEAVFIYDIQLAFEVWGANCWLKNGSVPSLELMVPKPGFAIARLT